MSTRHRSSVWNVFRTFSWLGWIGFGGPAAHVALMRRELVERKGWIDEAEFYDAYAFTNLLPGPNSTQLSMMLGYWQAGMAGLWAAGAGFIWPAMVLVMLLSTVYQTFINEPIVHAALLGIQSVVLAVIIQALYMWGRNMLTRKGVDRFELIVIAGFAFFLSQQTQVNEWLLLIVTGFFVAIWRYVRTLQQRSDNDNVMIVEGFSLMQLFWSMFKIGLMLFGSGYVLFAFLKQEFVTRLGILPESAIADSIAMGQITPGPLFTSATFIGYFTNGWLGGLTATVAIFLPSFLLIGFFMRRMSGLRSLRWFSDALDGVQIASFVFMAKVTCEFALPNLQLVWWVVLAVIALITMFKWPISSLWLLIVGGLVGAFFG